MGRKPARFWTEDPKVLEIMKRYVRNHADLRTTATALLAYCQDLGVDQDYATIEADVKWYAPVFRRKLGLLPPAKTEGVTVRLSSAAMEAFRDLAQRTSRSLGSVVSEMAEEALRMRQHPGIVFAGAPGNRRARLEGGPDVWEVVAIHQNGGEDKARTLQVLTHLIPEQVDTALRYYRLHPEEVERLVGENERSVDEWQKLYPHLLPLTQAAG